jgi:hypothetical protein
MRKEQLLEHFDTYFLCATADELPDQYKLKAAWIMGFEEIRKSYDERISSEIHHRQVNYAGS